MSSFPKDLYFEIAPHSTIRTLVILCLCSRAWHLAASSVLYRDIGRFTADEPSVSANLLQTVASSERIGRLVQRLHVYCSDRCAVRLLSQALRNTPNLRSLRVRCLGSVIKEDESCREALIDLKQLRVLSFNFLRDNAVFCRLGPLRHIRITGNAGRAGPVPNIERMIMKSCDTITHLNVSSHLLRRIMDGIPSSAAVFAHLETIMINDTLPLLLLLGQKLPALKIIRAKQLNQRYLLHDPEFLPSLEALQFPCIPDPTAGDSPAGRDVTSSRPGRNLRHLNLEMSDMITTSSTGSVDEFYSFVEPVKLGSLSSLTLNAVRDVQSLTALSALQYELTQGNNLRMIYLELRMKSSGVESTMQRLRELAEDNLLNSVAYIRLQTNEIVGTAQVQLGNILLRTSARTGHYRVRIRERGVLKKSYTNWTRAGEGDGWTRWLETLDEQDKLMWPDCLLSLHGMELLAALGLRE